MTTAATSKPDPRAEALVASYERAGYLRATPAILQPAEPFLDLSGEDIRKRMFLTTDASGHELCLRPDLTIPVARDYLASPVAGKPQGFCYLGPVFRDRAAGTHALEHDVDRKPLHTFRHHAPGEFMQAGIESFGRTDIAAADAETIALGLAATTSYGLKAPGIRMGDVGLFAALVAALDVAPGWKRRLIKDFNRKSNLAHDLDRLSIAAREARPEYQGVLAALAGSDPKAAHALVADLLSIAGITTVGGRSVGEIADRFLEQSALGASSVLPPQMRELVEHYLRIEGDPASAAQALRKLAADARIALTPALDLFESRNAFLAQRGVDVKRIRFSTAFGRGFDYYTGMVFELHDGAQGEPLVAGGRYDGMLTRLGSAQQVPAIGFSVWIERLTALEGSK